MATQTFRLKDRLVSTIDDLKKRPKEITLDVVYILGWFSSFFILMIAWAGDFNLQIIYIIIHGFFWFMIHKHFLKYIRFPVELLALFFLLVLYLDIQVLSSARELFLEAFTFWDFRIALHIFLTGALSLFGGILIIENNQKNGSALVKFALIFLLGHLIVFFEHTLYQYPYNLLLIVVLLKYTNWLETLSKAELMIYFLISVVAFYLFRQPEIFDWLRVNLQFSAGLGFSLPYFFYLFTKFYLLALIIKIPIVIIYSHARLSRKLWISGLFQSSFPQFIQLVILIFIFYLFVSGWQADNLRKALLTEMTHLKSDQLSGQIFSQKIDFEEANELQFEDYRTKAFDKFKNEIGVVKLERSDVQERQHDYFLYFNDRPADRHILYFCRIDSVFLGKILENTPLMAGTGIMAYSYLPSRWESFLNDYDLWQTSELLKLNPMAIINPLSSQTAIDARHHSHSENGQTGFDNIKIRFGSHRLDLTTFIFGRVYLPLNQSDAFFAFDITYYFTDLFQWNFMTKILLLLILVFSILNLLIIRRVVGFGSQINQTIIQKFDALKQGVREVSSGNLDYKVKIEGEDEFVEFGAHFNQMSETLKQTIDESREKERLNQELKIARNVQLNLLPANLPELPGYELCAAIKTATEVGGDFYDFFELDEKRYLFAIGDVSGKGSSAAFYMAQFISLLRLLPKFTQNPAEIANRLNDYVTSRIKDRQIFITAVIGVLNIEDGSVQMVRAGHNLPVLIPAASEGSLKEIKPPGLGIGLTKSESFFSNSMKTENLTLDAGDILILYTDGIIEATRPAVNGDETEDDLIYGEQRFLELLEKNRQVGAKMLMKIISADLDSFYKNHPLVDDYTLLFIEKR